MKISDILEMKGVDDVAQNFGRIQREFEDLREFAVNERQRDEKQIVTENLCHAFELQCGRLKDWINEPVDMVAWATRNIYELNLLSRFIAASDENTAHWLTQRAKDEIDVIEGILEWTQSIASADDEVSPATKDLQKRLRGLYRAARNHDIDVSRAKPKQVAELARTFNVEKENKALFKLLSKYVHPSSWVINAPRGGTQDQSAYNVLWVVAQVYAQSAFQTLSEYMSKPD